MKQEKKLRNIVLDDELYDQVMEFAYKTKTYKFNSSAKRLIELGLEAYNSMEIK